MSPKAYTSMPRSSTTRLSWSHCSRCVELRLVAHEVLQVRCGSTARAKRSRSGSTSTAGADTPRRLDTWAPSRSSFVEQEAARGRPRPGCGGSAGRACSCPSPSCRRRSGARPRAGNVDERAQPTSGSAQLGTGLARRSGGEPGSPPPVEPASKRRAPRRVGRVDVDVADERPGRVAVGDQPVDDGVTVCRHGRGCSRATARRGAGRARRSSQHVDALGRRAGVDGVEGEGAQVVDHEDRSPLPCWPRRGRRIAASSAGHADAAAHHCHTLGPQAAGMLGLVPRHQAAVGRHDPPPGQVVGLGQQAAHRPRRTRESRPPRRPRRRSSPRREGWP